MKFTQLKVFESYIRETEPGKSGNIYLILGKDSFERKACVDLLIEHLLKGEKSPHLALKVFQGGQLEMDAMMEELNALPFFSDKRLVIVQNTDELSKKELLQIEAYFERPNPTLCLILSATAFAATTNFYKKAEKAGVLLDIAEEKPWEKEKTMREWIMMKVAAQGLRIDPQAVQLLLKQIGTDQAFLHSELEKLFCYIGERKEISSQDIAAITASVNLENSWQLCDAIFSRNAAGALRIAKALLSDGTAFLGLLRQIRTQVQTDYQIFGILSQGGGAAEVTKQFPYMRGQILDRHMQAARGFGAERFKKAMLAIDETESLAKNGQGNDDFLSELLIAKLVL